MKLIAIRIFIVMIMFSWCELFAQRKFNEISGNGALSPDGKWYIEVSAVELVSKSNVSSYVRIELINLPNNKFSPYHIGKMYFDYTIEQKNKSKPEFILYDKNLAIGPLSKIIWNINSKSVSIYSRSGTIVFTYNIREKNFNVSKISNEEFLKRKKSFIKLSHIDGLFSVPEKKLEHGKE